MKNSRLVINSYNKRDILFDGERFLIGNGHLGYRGTLEEYTKEERVSLNVIGFYDRYQDKWRESIDMPNPFYIKIDGIDALKDEIKRHKLTLDFESETVSRSTTFNKGYIRSRRSINEDDVLLLDYTFKKESIGETLFGIDLDIYDQNGPHFKDKKIERVEDLIVFKGITNEDKIACMIVSYKAYGFFYRYDEERNLYVSTDENIKRGAIHVIAKVYTRDITGKDIAEFKRYITTPFSTIFERNAERFKKIYNNSVIEIAGDDRADLAIKYCIYNLLILENDNSKTSIPARGLSSQTYKGAIFWDSEIFMLPFYITTDPKMARNMLEYRINTLPGAVRKGKHYGYEGAFYAWESQDDGDEYCCKYNVTDPYTGKPLRTYFNEKQIHISADIVYALDQYIKSTGDMTILDDGGYKVIEEVVRFILSFAKKEDDDLYHIRDIIGPDEYHERIDDNAFTSYMFKRACQVFLSYHKDDVDQDLLNRTNDFIDNVYLKRPDENGIIEQFDGYLSLKDIKAVDLLKQRRDEREYLGTKDGLAFKTRVIKQADVLSLLVLLDDIYPNNILEKNYDFYKDYTEHGSTLSKGMCALALCKINRVDEAYDYFLDSALVDLERGKCKQFAGGIYIGGSHVGSYGTAYQCITKGFCNMKMEDGRYTFKSNLPDKIQSITINFIDHNKQRKVKVTKDDVKEMKHD